MNAVEIQRWARYAVEAWTDPTQFETPHDFLAAVTEVLDNLAEAFGKEPPRIEGIWS